VNAQLRKNGGVFFSCPSFLGEAGPSITLDVSLKGDYFELLAEGNAFARLDKSFCREVRRVVDLGAEFKACLECKQWEDFKTSWKPYQTTSYTATFTVDVNVYSVRHHADKIGTLLMHSGIFLQHPAHDVGDSEYHNPQILDLHSVIEQLDDVTYEPDETLTHVVVPNLTVPGNPAPSTQDPDNVDLILNSLSHIGILHEIRTDTNRIKSELMP
jgi:SWI/SNF-related matrix-associated actin-dependent regulator of chromatin subfamily A3